MSTFEQRKSVRGTGDGKQDRKGSVDAPVNMEAERILIATAMPVSRVYKAVAEKVKPEHFFDPLHIPSVEPYKSLPGIEYPFHDRDRLVTACGRICMRRKKMRTRKSSTVAVSGGRTNAARFFRHRM